MARNFLPEVVTKSYWMKILEACGFTNIIDTDIFNQHCFYDISADLRGVPYRFELKNRSIPFSKYNDNTCDYQKYIRFVQTQSDCDHCYLVSFFSDCYTISDILYDEHEEDEQVCPKTTMWGGRRIETRMVHYTKPLIRPLPKELELPTTSKH